MSTDDDDNDERKALTKALAVLRALRPLTASAADRKILTKAWYLVTRAMTPAFESKKELNNKRHEAAIAISAVNGAADTSALSQDEIGKATNAAAALLAALDR